VATRRVLGIDAGGTKLLGGVVDDDGGVHGRVHRLWGDADRREVLDTVVDAVDEIRSVHPDIEAVGFGIPSLVSVDGAVSMWSTHLPLDDLSFRDLMSERLGLPVYVDNDANCALLAEYVGGEARGALCALLLTLGTGIGGALMVGGRLHRGASGAAGELGHVVVDFDGPRCQGKCPNRGCLEVMASGTAIGREGAVAAGREPSSALARAVTAGREITGSLVTELAHDGDAVAIGVVAHAGRMLGVGLASLANAFDPDVMVIGGGAVAADELLLQPAREEMRARMLPPLVDSVRVTRAYFGEEAGMRGAALLALNGDDRR
jgi:glucokinase